MALPRLARRGPVLPARGMAFLPAPEHRKKQKDALNLIIEPTDPWQRDL